MSKHQDDGKFVVVQGGQRVSGQLHTDQKAALQEAERQRKLSESKGQAPAKPVEVKQNLYG